MRSALWSREATEVTNDIQYALRCQKPSMPPKAQLDMFYIPLSYPFRRRAIKLHESTVVRYCALAHNSFASRASRLDYFIQ